MANKFVTFLQAVGRDIEKGFEKVLPFIAPASALLSVVAPGAAPIEQAVATTVITIEQKFAALGQQSGTGPHKLANALEILEPFLLPYFGNNKDEVSKYVQSVVTFLNSIPAVPA